MRAELSLKLERWTTPFSLPHSGAHAAPGAADGEQSDEGAPNYRRRSYESYPSTADMVHALACSRYRPSEITHLCNVENAIEIYKKLSYPVLKNVFAMPGSNDIPAEFEHIIFYGKMDNGADIVITKATAGEIKIRIFHANLGMIVSSVHAVLDEILSIQRYLLHLDGAGISFAAKPHETGLFQRDRVRLLEEHRVFIRIYEDRHMDPVLEGTTKNYKFLKRLFHAQKGNIILLGVFALFFIFAIVTDYLIHLYSPDEFIFHRLVQLADAVTLVLMFNYAILVFFGALSNKRLINWGMDFHVGASD